MMLLRALVAIGIVAAVAAPAAADNAKADALFKKGKKLLAEGKYADACQAFEASQRAEPTIGTLLNVAKCYEEWGKLATAYDTYVEAARQAEDAADDRAERIKERVETIEPTVPTLVIRADSKPVDLVVKLDGKELAIGELNAPRRLDPGEHVIEYGIADGDKKRITVTLEANDHKTTTLERLAAMQVGGPVEEALEPDEKPIVVDDPNKGRTRRILGLATAGAGVVMIGISSWVVLDARADYRAALAAHCNAEKMCDDIGLDATRDARSRANIGTVLFSVGLAAVAGGAILYFTAPRPAKKEHARIQPVVTPDGAGVVLSGSF
jgi:tetratricopeptide (TPR) repeat protein